MRGRIFQALGMVEKNNGSKYMGLPNIISRNKSVILGFLNDYIHHCIQGYDRVLLSWIGKEVMLKMVVRSHPNYVMRVFLLPLEFGRYIEQMMNKFLWNSSSSQGNAIHWICWNQLFVHKDQGIMRFRSLRDINLVLGKQCWRLITKPNSLMEKIFKARYYTSETFLAAKLGKNPSFGEPWLPHRVGPFITSVTPTFVQ